jgi:hypothetical protein
MNFVLSNFTSMLDDRWNFIIFHGNKNKVFIESILNTNKQLRNNKHRIRLINLNADNLTIDDYNTLFKSKDFYKNIPTELFLVFQTDTMICSKYRDYIYRFLKYDYVGAPWSDGRVGNGGLSLRRKSKMLEILDAYIDTDKNHNEDGVFSGEFTKLVSTKKPTFEQAKEFSIETVFHNKSFGLHKAWEYNDEIQLAEINTFCPGLNELRSLQ